MCRCILVLLLFSYLLSKSLALYREGFYYLDVWKRLCFTIIKGGSRLCTLTTWDGIANLMTTTLIGRYNAVSSAASPPLCVVDSELFWVALPEASWFSFVACVVSILGCVLFFFYVFHVLYRPSLSPSKYCICCGGSVKAKQ